MKEKVEKILDTIISPFKILNRRPVLFKGKNFQLVFFGVFMVISIFISNSLLLLYLNSKGVYFSYHPILPLGIMLFSMLFFTKFFHVFVLGLEFFKKPLHYMNQTVMYNQGGILGTAIGALIVSWLEGISLVILLDGIIFGSTLGLFIGRLACYNYGCCYGQPTNSKFNVRYSNPDSKVLRKQPELKDVPLHPTQLIASLFNLFLFIMASIFVTSFETNGVILITFVISYNLFRFMTQKTRNSAKVSILSHTALIYLIFGLLLLLGTIVFHHFIFSITPFVHSISFRSYLNNILLNGKYMLTLLILSLPTFFFYGLHGKKLGQYFGG